MEKIKTFEELYEAVKELFVTGPQENCERSENSPQDTFVCYMGENADEYLVQWNNSKDTVDYFWIYLPKYEFDLTAYIKDPQKIYNVIKAIKECEEENGKD